jgi:hypothetical protein
MKKSILTIAIGMGLVVMTLGQDPPSMPGSHGDDGNQPAGAPIDGGLGILLAMGAAYGGKKLYKAYRER